MNMFDDAKYKEKIMKLPTHYDVVKRGRVVNIYVDFIKKFYINEKIYILSDELFSRVEDNETYIVDNIEFEILLFDNFYKVSKIFSSNSSSMYNYFLRKGYLHSTTNYAYQRQSKVTGDIYGHYYVKGREIRTDEFKYILRQKKLERLSK